jgi:hypothetical protein
LWWCCRQRRKRRSREAANNAQTTEPIEMPAMAPLESVAGEGKGGELVAVVEDVVEEGEEKEEEVDDTVGVGVAEASLLPVAVVVVDATSATPKAKPS